MVLVVFFLEFSVVPFKNVCLAFCVYNEHGTGMVVLTVVLVECGRPASVKYSCSGHFVVLCVRLSDDHCVFENNYFNNFCITTLL